MPSSTKTTNIGLNQWAENEYPKRQDFLDDNYIIDTEIGNLKKIAHGAVSDLATLKAIDTTNLPDNITIIVKSLGFYRLDSTSSVTADDNSVVQPTTGFGRWINNLETHKAEDASTTVKGHVQLATNAEVLAGTDTSKVITPKTLEDKIVDYGNIIGKSGSFTLALTERNKVVSITFGPVNITVPENNTVAFPIGTQITFLMGYNATATFVPASGVTLYSKDTKRIIDGQYASASLIKTAINTWYLIGALK